VFLAVNERGLCAIGLNTSKRQFLNRLQLEFKGPVIKSNRRTQAAQNQLRSYFTGQHIQFDLPLDLSRLTEFQHLVLWTVYQIPPGAVITYAELAHSIGKPNAYRAVGQALSHNPIPIVIPCHRVIASDGSLGGYQGEQRRIDTKAKLLTLEGVTLA
jgi:methylated-DNA-[protein]-cysteine S-methyltransferase